MIAIGIEVQGFSTSDWGLGRFKLYKNVGVKNWVSDYSGLTFDSHGALRTENLTNLDRVFGVVPPALLFGPFVDNAGWLQFGKWNASDPSLSLNISATEIRVSLMVAFEGNLEGRLRIGNSINGFCEIILSPINIKVMAGNMSINSKPVSLITSPAPDLKFYRVFFQGLLKDNGVLKTRIRVYEVLVDENRNFTGENEILPQSDSEIIFGSETPWGGENIEFWANGTGVWLDNLELGQGEFILEEDMYI